jgi:glycerol-3-phosphate dehydrogenase (NAD(P)+)
LSPGITRIFAAFWAERNRDCRGVKDEDRGQGEVQNDEEGEAVSRIAVIGAGAWGTGLSIVLGRRGSHQVRLWAHEKEVRESISTRRVNELFLPGQLIPESVSPTGSLPDALNRADIVVSVMPSQHCRQLFEQMRPHLTSNMLFVSATKGLEENTLLRMTEVIAQVVSQKIGSAQGFRPRIGALSGPSFAKEVARGDPTAITIASQDAALAETIQREFGDPRFRVYTNDDVAGVELGGALKNVIAIAAGVCDGLGLGHNSIAALITRGLAEITRLAVACGGRRETLAGLAGLGDLVLTCTGGLSRNRSVGVELGRGRKLPDIIAGMHGAVAEGVFTTQAAIGLARARGVEMPITEQMDAILHRSKAPADAIRDLMARSGKSEIALSS